MTSNSKLAVFLRHIMQSKQAMWESDLEEMARSRRVFVRIARVLTEIGIEIWEGQLTLRAMSLVYTTLLSLIPLLAISFSVLKGFGVHRDIEPFLITFLAPLGDKAEEIAFRFVQFIDNTKVSVLGYLGFALLFYAVVSLMQKVESAFNYVWRVNRNRTIAERIRDYLTLIIVGPTLMFVATGMWASILGTDIMERVAGIVPLGWLIHLVTRILPVLLIIVAFAFVYALVPNTKVHWRPALVGGVVAGALWNIGGVGFAVFVSNSANYPTIYSSFATAIFFMIWLYVAWMILLIGGSISFHVQNPCVASRFRQPLRLSNRMRERLALAITAAVGRRFYAGESPHTAASLTEQLRLPGSAVDEVLAMLESARILIRAGGEGITYVPARSWESVSVQELMSCVRTHGEDAVLALEKITDASIAEVWTQFENALCESVDNVSLKDLSLVNHSNRSTA